MKYELITDNMRISTRYFKHEVQIGKKNKVCGQRFTDNVTGKVFYNPIKAQDWAYEMFISGN